MPRTWEVGWIAWELMLAHDQFSSFQAPPPPLAPLIRAAWQGLVYANGTWRDPSELACLQRLATHVPPCA